ncbi:uncharacterized protein LOC141850936 [Brevipalpus obovatus]|uniref:uncharacterized protein LOC141850936 n=1 Tax=Brevipalpus obovatus TaxID=246614 RepID=UPI003D9F12C7
MMNKSNTQASSSSSPESELDSFQRMCQYLEGDISSLEGAKVSSQSLETARLFFKQYIDSSRRSIQNRKTYPILELTNDGDIVQVNIPAKSDDWTPSASTLSKNSWFIHVSKLILTINSLIDELNKSGIEYDELKLTGKPFRKIVKADFVHTELKVISAFALIVRYATVCLIQLLSDHLQSSYTIPVEALINVCARCCQVSVQRTYSRLPPSALLVKSIQIDAFRILNHLIVLLGNDLAIHGSFINHIFSTALNDSVITSKRSRGCGERNANLVTLKSRLYESIALFHERIGPHMFVDQRDHETVTKHFMKDIKPASNLIELRATKTQTYACSPDPVFCSHKEIDSFHKNCMKATLNFIRNSSVFIDAGELEQTAKFFLNEFFNFYIHPMKSESFFSHSSVRKKFLALIKFFALHDETISLTDASNVFTKVLQSDPDGSVRNCCHGYLADINAGINPKRHIRICEVMLPKSTGNSHHPQIITTTIENVSPDSIDLEVNPNPNPNPEPLPNLPSWNGKFNSPMELKDKSNLLNKSIGLNASDNSQISMLVNVSSSQMSDGDEIMEVTSADAQPPSPESGLEKSLISPVASSSSSVTVADPVIAEANMDNGPSSQNYTEKSPKEVSLLDGGQQTGNNIANNYDPRLNNTELDRGKKKLIDVENGKEEDVGEEDDEDIFAIEVPKSIIQNSKRRRLDPTNPSDSSDNRREHSAQDVIELFRDD